MTNDYASKENYLAHIHELRRQQQRKDGEGTASPGDIIRRAIQRDQVGHREADSGSHNSPAGTFSGDGSEEDGSGSIPRDEQEYGFGHRVSPRNNSVVHQHDGPVREHNKQSESWQQRIKSTFKPFEQVFPQAAQNKEEQKKRAKTYGKTLSDSESLRLKPELINVLLWQTIHMDRFIEATTRGHEEVIIWSSMDLEEIEIVADFLIDRGRANAQTAQMIRHAANIMVRLKLGLITVPRAYRTYMTYWQRGFSLT